MNNTKRILILLLIVIVVGALALYAGYYKKRNSVVQNNVATTTEAANMISAADWKIYQDDSQGVQFKYPNDWFVVKAGARTVINSKEDVTDPSNTADDKRIFIQQSAKSYDDVDTMVAAYIENLVNTLKLSDLEIIRTNITINTKPAIQLEYTLGNTLFSQIFILAPTKKAYLITYNGNTQNKEILTNILNTLTFK